MATEVSNTDSIIDSRDVIAYLEELEGLIEEARTDGTDEEELAEMELEYDRLMRFANTGESEISGWSHGETLIHEDYFTEYAKELTEELGYLPAELPGWIADAIDWDQVADAIKEDYTDINFDGVDYWARS